MTTPSRISRRHLADRWVRAAPWISVRGDALATLAEREGFERLNWYDGGEGALKAHVAGSTAPGAVDQARATLEPAFERLDQGLFQVTETGTLPWTLYAAPLTESEFAVAHTAWVGGSCELRVAETSALVLGSLLLDLATALPRMAPSERPPLEPPGSGETASLPRDLLERLEQGHPGGSHAAERLQALGWSRDLADDFTTALLPPVLSVSSQAVSVLDAERTSYATGRHWVGANGWTWRVVPDQRPAPVPDHDDETPHQGLHDVPLVLTDVTLARLGPDAAIRSVFEPLPWFTRWGRRA